MSRLLSAFLLVALLVITWQTVRLALPEHERAARSQVKAAVESAFPEQAEEARARFGLKRLHAAPPNRSEVVLVHGLDDPGMVWMNLAPALNAAGYGVSILNYPNDQPIRESARFFAETLRALPQQGIGEITIVAHSMGGLVSREMLSDILPSCVAPVCRKPRVVRLIMVGTPNHGSYLARFRGLSELREQLSRLLDGEAGWLDSIFDGAGEAGLDLTPGSPFLEQLNSRAYPADTAMYVIAGIIAKDQAKELANLIDDSTGSESDSLVVPLAEGIGDGLVSLESATLPGVPLFRVSGNHLSIIRNVSETSERTPPAIPIVLDLLRE